MTVPNDYPTDPGRDWQKTHDSETAKIWRDGAGDVISFTQSFNATTDYWEISDTTGEVVEGRACGPFEEYLDAVEYVNTFLPRFGREELPDDVVEVPDDEIVEIGSYPQGATDRECEKCGEAVFTSFQVEYGDGSHDWYCVKCASERFNWSIDEEKDSTVGFSVNGSGAEGRDAVQAATTALEGHADALVEAGVVDVNGAASALKTLGRYSYGNRRDDPDELPPAPSFKRDVMDLMVEYREEHPDVKWHEMRDVLNELRQYAHEYAREESGKRQGRRELLEEIEASEMTPNEWFEQHVRED